MKTNSNKIKYFLNWAIFLLGLTCLITGIIRFSSIFMFIALKIGISSNQIFIINFIHRWTGVITGGLILIHIILNWGWILKIGRSSATENLLISLKKENYLGLKYLYSEEEILENFKEILPNILTLAEAQSVQKKDNFTAFLGLILASFDFLNLDRVFSEITLQKDLPEIIKNLKIEEIPILGRRVEEIQFEIEKYG